jgi:hypothetical protein
MPDYPTASRTKQHFQDQLLRDHPEIVSIAPRLKLDGEGHPVPNEAVIVIGVKTRRVHPSAASIPDRLVALDPQNRLIPNQFVEVLVEEEGEILAEMLIARRRPAPGGYSLGHFRVAAGTLGSVVRVGATWGYILSNNHVLAATNSGAVGDDVYQPGVGDGGGPGDQVGVLDRWVPISFSRPNQVDCALAKALDPWNQHVTRHIHGIGVPRGTAVAQVGDALRKSGRTTQITTGILLSDSATIRVSYGAGLIAQFDDQLQYTRMTQGGDSGSLIWQRDDLTVVGLHFAGSGTSSYGNKIDAVLQQLGQASRQLPASDLGISD